MELTITVEDRNGRIVTCSGDEALSADAFRGISAKSVSVHFHCYSADELQSLGKPVGIIAECFSHLEKPSRRSQPVEPSTIQPIAIQEASTGTIIQPATTIPESLPEPELPDPLATIPERKKPGRPPKIKVQPDVRDDEVSQD